MKKLLLLTVLLIIPTTSAVIAGPVLKPRKYYGPIPPGSITARVGFYDGATNEEMIQFLDRGLGPEKKQMDDFSGSLAVDLMYMYKPHPQFGVRVNLSAAFLRSSGSGEFVEFDPSLPDTIPNPVRNFERTFDTDLFTLEVSGAYYFTDAAVKDFQPYVGGGFSLGVPHEVFTETRTDADTGQPVPGISESQWSALAGVHAVLGAFYYITNRTAISAEGRVQLMQSKFPLSTPNEDGMEETVRFVVDYTGFYLSIGITRAF